MRGKDKKETADPEERRYQEEDTEYKGDDMWMFGSAHAIERLKRLFK